MTESRALQIAIDGPAGAGKSTVARKLADKLQFLYIDTGAMYRAATWLGLKHGVSLDDGPALAKLAAASDILLKPADQSSDGKIRVFVDNQEITREIRTGKMSELVAGVAALKEVRQVLVDRQRELAKNICCVIDGRDIGTVVSLLEVESILKIYSRAIHLSVELILNAVSLEKRMILAKVVSLLLKY